jgi:hypothetical protein
MPSLLWQEAQRFYLRLRRCSSSVVEHSLGKGEVESSILSCSTTSSMTLAAEPPDGLSSYQIATATHAGLVDPKDLYATGSHGKAARWCDRLNQRIQGSSPCAPTIDINGLSGAEPLTVSQRSFMGTRSSKRGRQLSLCSKTQAQSRSFDVGDKRPNAPTAPMGTLTTDTDIREAARHFQRGARKRGEMRDLLGQHA